MNGFDLLAPIYDRLAGLVFGRSIRRAQVSGLGQLPKGGKVLAVGGGTGTFLPDLCRTVMPEQVVYVEASEKMLRRANKRMKKEAPAFCDRILFVHATFEEWHKNSVAGGAVGSVGTAGGSGHEELRGQQDGAIHFDGICTHFFLDLFHGAELQETFHALAELGSGETWWYCTDFQTAKEKLKGASQRMLVWVMYRFFRLVCGISAGQLADFHALFASGGWQRQWEALYFRDMIAARIWKKGSQNPDMRAEK